MGSPITFSGFNNIDFNMILNAVMQQESQPLTALQNQQSTLQAQNSAFGTLVGKLSALGTAADALKDSKSLALLSATSSDASVGVSTTTGTIPGTYEINVSQLARAQVTASSSTYASPSDVVASGGTLTLTSADGPVTITVTQPTTLQELADAINAQQESPVTASIVQSSAGHYQLVLTAANTGTANSFTVATALTGGSGVGFVDTDGDGTSGDTAADNAQTALDATFTVNGLSVTSSSNTITDVVPGVTLTLTKKPTSSVLVKVSRDTDKAKDAVQKFIDAYNAVVQFTKDQASADANGQASISRDPLLRGFRESLRNSLLGEYAGAFGRLAAVGVGFDRDGNMTLDDATFQKAMTTSPADLQELFSGASGDAGAFGAISTLIDAYTGSGGLVSMVRDRIDEEVTNLGKRLDSMQAALDIRRQSLQKEYIAADLAMTQLKSQSGSLQSLGTGITF